MAGSGYATNSRRKILDFLKSNSDRTVTVADIDQYLKRNGDAVNITTIYRYLDKLLAEHVIIKYADAGSERAVYQYSGEMGHCVQHLHLKCVKCGRILHLDCGFMDEFRNHLKEDHKFRLLCCMESAVTARKKWKINKQMSCKYRRRY